MRTGLFAFILLSALVHAIIIGIEDDWIFNINDSHEQGRSSLDIELLPKSQNPIQTSIAKPLNLSESKSKPITTPITKKSIQQKKSISIKISAAKTTKLKNAEPKSAKLKSAVLKNAVLKKPVFKNTEPQKTALLNTDTIINTDNKMINKTTDSRIKNKNREKIKTLLNNELSKHFYYPKAAQRKNRQGSVLLAFTISHQGKIENINIEKSSGFKVLDNAAIKAIKKINANKDLAKALNGEYTEHTLPVIYKLTRH